jgi:hypothetical protein
MNTFYLRVKDMVDGMSWTIVQLAETKQDAIDAWQRVTDLEDLPEYLVWASEDPAGPSFTL